jgi:hypothetical protein
MNNHEQAAFGGAASVVKPEEPTFDQIMRQPWRYPQGRGIPAEEDALDSVCLNWSERLFVVAVWCAGMAVSISVLRWLLS